MKAILRNTAIDSFSLYLLTLIISSISIAGGFFTFLFAGLIFFLMSTLLKPILKIITLPLNIITFGLFSFLINAIILYLLTVFVTQISISDFIFNGIGFAGFIIPKIYFNLFFTYIVSSFLLSAIISSIQWLIKK